MNLDDEKEVKIHRQDGDKVRQWVMFFLLLSMLGFIAGRKTHQALPIDPFVKSTNLHPQQVQFVETTTEKAAALPSNQAPLSATTNKLEEKSESELATMVNVLDEKVRNYKSNLKRAKLFMETDPGALKLTKELQDLTRVLILKKYGTDELRVLIDLVFPESIPDYSEATKNGQLTLEMAPIDLIPCSVYNFLEIARTWKSGSFHRNAGHVLQVQSNSDVRRSMPFQEYSPEFPHKKGTVGYAGRPSGPGWYVSIMDNTRNHGPGSQQKDNPHEADSNFGRVVQGMDDVVPRIHSIPQEEWLDRGNQISITKMTILVPDANAPNQWIPW